ncbi:MAG TPA: YihY/virulence factor BrkB family protein [Jatrophihabitans sp.]|nr:YihY/virulence factor BrkB family protein [Jatrophihabitans sp.]
MGLTALLDRFQRRHPAFSFPIAVVYKFFDDSGTYLAALIAYYAFVSLFPLLLLGTTVLGLVLTGHDQLQQQILDSAVRQIPVVGSNLSDPHRISGGVRGLVIGTVGALYGGLGIGQATQYSMNQAWAVPRHDRPNPLKGRLRSLLLLSTAGVGVLATSALSTLGVSGAGSLALVSRLLVLAGSVLINAGIFVFAFRLAAERDLTLRDVLPGALLAALAWQVLQSFGVYYVNHVVRHASDTNGVFAVVLGLLAFLYLAGISLVLCVEVNVVRVKRLYPRALLTPFIDDVDLTAGDQRAYRGQAQAQAAKTTEQIDVRFDG